MACAACVTVTGGAACATIAVDAKGVCVEKKLSMSSQFWFAYAVSWLTRIVMIATMINECMKERFVVL